LESEFGEPASGRVSRYPDNLLDAYLGKKLTGMLENIIRIEQVEKQQVGSLRVARNSSAKGPRGTDLGEKIYEMTVSFSPMLVI
jgi:hypothetical protein